MRAFNFFIAAGLSVAVAPICAKSFVEREGRLSVAIGSLET
jgi:hypothetical protein